jgi:hypothetical protein
MSPQTTLAEAVTLSRTLLGRYLAGFTDENHTRQAPGLPNHVAWTLGHLALTMERVAERFDGKPVSPSDFIPGQRGDAAHFGAESVAFGSAPVSDPAAYPSLGRCTAVLDAATERLSAAIRQASDAKLAEPTKWGNTDITHAALAMRMVFHNGTHTGQIADLRRVLGFKSIFS